MAANSLPRRVVKKLLAPVLSDRVYSVLQAGAMAWDIRTGNWHEDELDLLPHLARPGETAIDIGANYGLYAYHLSRVVGPGGRVVCFEPLPFTAMAFRTIGRMLRFQGVELVNKGCGEIPGRTLFTVPVTDTGAISAGLAHFKGRRDNRPDGEDGRRKFAVAQKTRDVECEVVRVDDLFRGVDNVSIIKCDIEGADLFALRGARQTLERNHPSVITEVNTWFLEGFGLKVEDLERFFGELGYAAHSFKNGRLVAPSRQDADEGTNWIWVHPARRERFESLLAH